MEPIGVKRAREGHSNETWRRDVVNDIELLRLSGEMNLDKTVQN